MKHKILAQFTGIFTFLILSICNVHAQFSVKGTLVDSLTHESEPYATIRITLDKSPEKPVRMNVTDAKGKFQEKLPQTGNYTLQITSVGNVQWSAVSPSPITSGWPTWAHFIPAMMPKC